MKIARDNHTSFKQAKRNSIFRGALGVILTVLAAVGFYSHGPGEMLHDVPLLCFYLTLALGLIMVLLSFQSAFNAQARNKNIDAEPDLYDPEAQPVDRD